MAKKKFPKIILGPVTLGFSNLKAPDTEGKYADDKYKAKLLFDNDDPNIEKLDRACREAAKAEWGRVPANLVTPGRDGDEYNAERVAEDKDPVAGYEGKVYMTAKSKFAPSLVDANKNPLELDEAPGSGDLVKVSCVLIPYKTGTSRGVSLQLRAVRVLERNSGRDYSDDFADDDDDYVGTASGGDGDDTSDDDDI